MQLLPAAPADGYYFDTGEGGDGDGADPVRWVVKALTTAGENDLNQSNGGPWNESRWQAVGASAWQVLSVRMRIDKILK